MSSNINTTPIIETYPTAGIDNNSQGFRDNFTSIKTALDRAKSEISELHATVLLKTSIPGQTPPVPVVNNLLGSSLTNGVYSQLNSKLFTGTIDTASTVIDLVNGPTQSFEVKQGTVMTFTGWKAECHNCIKLILKWPTGETGQITCTTTPNTAIVKPTSKTIAVYELWSIDAGVTIYRHLITEF